MDPSALLFIVLVGLVFIFAIWWRVKTFPKCSKCGGNLELDAIRDPMGLNLSKKITLSFYLGPRKWTEELQCPKCGHKQPYSYWGS
jgi:DNA-directed RNA polymerase subunit RPC12/RpoP